MAANNYLNFLDKYDIICSLLELMFILWTSIYCPFTMLSIIYLLENTIVLSEETVILILTLGCLGLLKDKKKVANAILYKALETFSWCPFNRDFYLLTMSYKLRQVATFSSAD